MSKKFPPAHFPLTSYLILISKIPDYTSKLRNIINRTKSSTTKTLTTTTITTTNTFTNTMMDTGATTDPTRK